MYVGFFSSSLVFCLINQFPSLEGQLASQVFAIPLQALVFMDMTDYGGQFGALLFGMAYTRRTAFGRAHTSRIVAAVAPDVVKL